MTTDDFGPNKDAPKELPLRQPKVQGAPNTSLDAEFDVVQAYRGLLNEDPELTKPLAAIEALIKMLRYYDDASTIMEIHDRVSEAIEKLLSSVANPTPLQAGTDLFKEYLLRSLRPRDLSGPHRKGKSNFTHGDQKFADMRRHLLDNADVFSSRAKDARHRVAEIGARYVLDGSTVLTHGGSRTVTELLVRAAKERQTKGGIMFNVIYVESAIHKEEGENTIATLRDMGVAVATIPESAVAYSLPQARAVFLGAETVCVNGGIISRLGTSQLAQLAHVFKIPLYVAAETHKMVNVFPLGQHHLHQIKQEVISFKTKEDITEDHGKIVDEVEMLDKLHMVDYTPPNLITDLITERGVMLPSGVFELFNDLRD